MCGIFVSIGFDPDRRHIDVVAHRGPDGAGWQLFDSPAGPVALGHRRLSIIDLDPRADQPMSSADRRYWLVFNGEIYNYLELREDLIREGCTLRTQSDAEILLEAYVVWGPQALDRLIGMFAFAIWDDHDKTLFLARDHTGIKPLVYHASGRGVAFGSEIKQLVDLETFRRRINLNRAHNFLASGVTDHLNETMFADANNLGAGDCLTLDLHDWRPGDPLPIREYWRPPNPDGVVMTERQASDRFRELFFDSVRLQMRADVRVGSCLSGGLDSSSIVCAQARDWPPGGEPLNVVSAVFPGSSVDESRFIDAVVNATGARAHRVTLSPDGLFDDFEAVLRAQDEPYGSTSIHAQYHVFRKAREAGVKVMLDGQGADELLGGYHGCFHYHYARLIRQGRLLALMQTLRERAAWHDVGYVEQLDLVWRRLPGPLRSLFGTAEASAPPEPQWMNMPALARHAPQEGGALAQALAAHGLPMARTLGEYCVTLTRATSVPMLLRYEDRNSMAHSVEARVPFLDHRIVEFLLRLGSQHKIVGGDTKRILRRALHDILPEIVLSRRDKLGFSTPEEAWFKGPLRAEVERRVEESLALYPDLFAPDATRLFVRQILDGARPFDFALWRIIVFGAWGRHFGMTH